VPSRWGRGLIAGHEFNERLELYAEIYDLQEINSIGGAPKQRELTLDMGGRKDFGSRRSLTPVVYGRPRHPGSQPTEQRAKLDRLCGRTNSARSKKKEPQGEK